MMKAIVIKTVGDPEMAEAIESGIRAGTEDARRAEMTHDQIEVVEAEIDRQHILEELVRVAVGNTKTAEDYALMQTKARADYAEDDGRPAWLRRMADRALGLYGLAVMALASDYRARTLCWSRRGGRRP